MEEFKPRTEAPNKANTFFYSRKNIFYPKYENECTWYAWGRQLELGTSEDELMKKLPTSNAENWFNETKYEKYSYPRVGDILCYRAGKYHYSKDGAGHVAIVEYVYPNQDIMISESGAKMKFKTRIVKYPYNYYFKSINKYTLEGFIHIKDYLSNNWVEGDYKTLYHKYMRLSPEVNATNKIKYKNLLKSVQDQCIKDRYGYARWKIGETIHLVEFKTDSKGNLWGKRKGKNTDTWLCVRDSSGNQVIKV